MDDIYLKALELARKELEGLMQERAHLDSRIAKLSRSIEGLASLSNDTDVSSEVKTKLLELEISEAMGLTEAIRQIIGAAFLGITPIQIRNMLVEEGFDPQKYSNMLTVIHNTLSRLERQGEIKRTVTIQGERGWAKS
jgi:hypothetical protein